MNGLLSNARRAFLRPANPRDYPHTASRIIGATLPVTIASTLARPAQGAFMGFTTRRRVSIPPPLNGAAWRVRPSGPDRGLVRPATYMPPARSGCPMPGKEEGGDARYSYRLGSGRRVMGRRWIGHNCPYLIISCNL